MRSFSVTDVAAMLGVNEESVRRWIREGKLVANRRIGRAGSSVELKDIIDFVNQPPRTYVKAMTTWLNENNIRYALKSDSSGIAATVASAATASALSGSVIAGIPGGIGAVLGATVGSLACGLTRQQIVLCDTSDHAIVDAVDTETTVSSRGIEAPIEKKEESTNEIKEVLPANVSSAVPGEDYAAKIVEEQKKLIKLKQELAKISAQISITEGQIEYYKLMIQQK